MVERVARAIRKAKFPMVADEVPIDPLYEVYARVAIGAMRDITPPMRNAMAAAMSPGKRPTPARVSCAVKHKIRWHAAIDAALEEVD